jgi:hypothetical protein
VKSGIGFFSALQIVFIVLKLCRVIAWPWGLVLIPMWGGAVLGLLIFAALILFVGKPAGKSK